MVNRITIALSIIIVGLTAMTSQIVFMREFLAVFYGNELSIGLILSSWLIGGAIGSYLLGKAVDRVKSKITAFCLCQLILSILLPLTVLAIRSARAILNVAPGEIIPLFPMIASSLVILAPVCIVFGFVFALACGIYAIDRRIGALRIGEVYILEAAGAVIGGLFTSFIFIKALGSIQIMAALGLLNITSLLALILSDGERSLWRRPFIRAAASVLFIIGIAMWFVNGWNNLETGSIKRAWKGFDLLSSRNSIYGNITIAKRLDQFSFFDNGLHLYTVPDKLTAEESVHFSLLEHPRPRKVLLIGGGVGGLAAEILKHPVEKVDYVELDPLIIKMAGSYLPVEYYEALEDPRISIKNLDGRFFVKTTDEKYDCILVNVGDPCTAQLNRLYTVEFFEEARRALKKGGILSFAVSSSENYISEELADILQSLYATASSVFPRVLVIPGDVAHFVASDEKGRLTYNYDILTHRAKHRALDVKFVREYYLFSKLSRQRISYMEEKVSPRKGIGVNYDWRPIAYYYDTIFWSSRFRGSLFTKALRSVTEQGIWYVAVLIFASVFMFGLASAKEEDFFERFAIVSVATAGFSAMAFQMLVLLSFQILYGYLFYKLAVIITAFMAGIVAGGLLIMTALRRSADKKSLLIVTQGLLSVCPIMLPLSFGWLASSGGKSAYWLGANMLFPALSAAAGLFTGSQFLLANAVYLKRGRSVGRTGGLSYGVDLFGSCLGALLTGAFFIPILGIPKTSILIAAANFIVLILFIASRNVEFFKKAAITMIVVTGIILGVHRVLCLSVMESFEDYFKYRNISAEKLRAVINRDQFDFIDEIKARVDPAEGVLVLHRELYFISYYVYPVKMYKFRKGYFKTSRQHGFGDVDKKWLDDRNIKWVILQDENDRLLLKRTGEMSG